MTKENAWQTCEKIFSQEPYPDGVFATNDTTAITILQYCREKGIRVPEQLKIVGYSNDPRTEIITPSITSVDQYPATMAERIVAALMELIQAKHPQAYRHSQEIIPIQLVERESSSGKNKTTKK
ncbi:substrate-binding domain-containing protein [Chitinophaga sedimenti]|uniref:substrate-binding domain-containing protein n=1 Tax=Chitinophaga sedimenti TaxID=2033606 RepID=UPI00249DA1AE|nr:substrate-binding domain-containing protein [Chitinophaga sedimenti]